MQSHKNVTTCLLFALAGAVLFVAAATAGGEKTVEAPSVLVQSAAVRLMPVRRTLTAYGTVEYAPEHSRVEDLQGEGVVEEVLVSVGQPVHAGDPLLRLLPTASASMEIGQGRLDLVFAEKTLDRLTELKEPPSRNQRRGAIRRGDGFQVAGRARGGPETVSRRKGTAPARRHGRCGGGRPRPGGDRSLFRARLSCGWPTGSRLRIRLGVEPEDIQSVRVGQEVRVRPMYPGAKPVTGRIGEIFRQVSPQTRLAEVIVPLPAVDGFLPGVMVRGEIFSRADLPVPAVPRSAVLFEGSKGYVFVVAGGVARRRFVEVGQDDCQFVEIVKGLEPAETVVTVGNYELADGMAVRFQGSR